MNARRFFWAATALVAGPALAQDQIVNPNAAAPAVALTPVPLSSYVPPPVAPEADKTPARLQPPTPVPPTEPIQPVIHKQRAITTPVIATQWPTVGTGPMWRWYGWGAANTPGIAPAVISGPTVPPSTSEPPKATPTVITTSDPKPSGNWVPAPMPVPAPPTVDLNPGPLPAAPAPAPPVAAPNPTAPSLDPWTSVAPSGASAKPAAPVVRASSKK